MLLSWNLTLRSVLTEQLVPAVLSVLASWEFETPPAVQLARDCEDVPKAPATTVDVATMIIVAKPTGVNRRNIFLNTLLRVRI